MTCVPTSHFPSPLYATLSHALASLGITSNSSLLFKLYLRVERIYVHSRLKLIARKQTLAVKPKTGLLQLTQTYKRLSEDPRDYNPASTREPPAVTLRYRRVYKDALRAAVKLSLTFCTIPSQLVFELTLVPNLSLVPCSSLRNSDCASVCSEGTLIIACSLTLCALDVEPCL